MSPRGRRGRSQGPLSMLTRYVRDAQSPTNRRSAWLEQTRDRWDYEALERTQSRGEAGAFAAQSAAMLISVLPNTPRSAYVRKKTKKATPASKVAVLPSSSKRTPRTALACKAHKRSVGLLPEWKQRVYSILDREGQAVTAGQRKCAHIPRYVDRMRPASAALTSGLARKAPRTSMESIVSSASSGETSSAMLARPSTLISNVSPAARTASRSRRV